MRGPKVVVIGAGSLFFGRQAVWQMVTSKHLNTGTLALVDTEPSHLALIAELGRKFASARGVELKIEASTDRREVLKDADFVVLSFADRSVKFRGLDCQIAEKYNIRMCSGDTIGPGGIMRTLREFPHILACAKDVQELCPEAWVINYINPTAANGIGLQRFAPEIKSFALCDGLHMPHVKNRYARRAGILEEDEVLTPEQDADFDLRITGPNHFTWVVKAENKGQDVVTPITEDLRVRGQAEVEGGDMGGAKGYMNNLISYELFRAYGYVPACIGHTKEYVRFWQGLGTGSGVVPPLHIWETDVRYERHAAMWREVQTFVLGTRPIEEFYDASKADHATDIIETMWAGLDKPFYINTPNQGAVNNMPDDAFLEMLCDLSREGPKPRAIGPAPIGLRGLWQQVLDTHELTVQAAVTGDRDILRTAFATDPLCLNIEDNDKMMEELLAAEESALPDCWSEGKGN